MKRLLKHILSILISIVVIFLIFKITNLKIFKYAAAAKSMSPTISPGDICLCKMKNYSKSSEIKRKTVVLLKHKDYNYLLTKRVIATEGESLKFRDDKPYIDGVPLVEPYVYHFQPENVFIDPHKIYTFMIEKNKVFVMGDNRNNSIDSRNPEFGIVNVADIVGRPIMILWSKNKSKICKIF